MFIMVVQIRGVVQCLCRITWDSRRALRLRVPFYQFCGHHNLIGQKHTDSKKGSFSYLNAPIIIRKESTVQNANDTNMTPKDYRMLYRFSHITFCGFVNKIKKHFTILMTLGVPGSGILRLMDIISSDTFFIFISQGGVICCALYSVGMIFYKLVGSIYLSADSSTVKISYLDFWGKRVDVCCPLSDIVPFSDTNERIMDAYVNLRRYSTPQKLHFTVRFGSVLDTKRFTVVFGNAKEFE